jgi:hypothetical protein
MKLRNSSRSLMMVSMLTLAALSVSTLPAHAEDQGACTFATCGDMTCSGNMAHNDKTYTGGDTIVVKNYWGELHVYICNGFTGEWEFVDRQAPPAGNPRGPVPGSMAPPAQTAPTSPAGPPSVTGPRPNAPAR